MTDNTEALPPLPQRWTTGDASTSEAGGFVAYSDYLELRRAALAQRQQLPEGWQLVPKVPTVAMNQAGALYAECAIPANADECYRAMLAAAPSLTAAPSAQAEPKVPLPPILFDGYAVYQALDKKAQSRTSTENVSDVLDAVVRLLRGIGKQEGK